MSGMEGERFKKRVREGWIERERGNGEEVIKRGLEGEQEGAKGRE